MTKTNQGGGDELKKAYFIAAIVFSVLVLAFFAFAAQVKAAEMQTVTQPTLEPTASPVTYQTYADARAAAKLAENTGDVKTAVDQYLKAEEAALTLLKNPGETKTNWQEIADWQRNNAAYALIMFYFNQSGKEKDKELLDLAAQILDARPFVSEKVKAKAERNKKFCSENLK